MPHGYAKFEHGSDDAELQPVYAKISDMIMKNEIVLAGDGSPPAEPDSGEFAILKPPYKPPENEGAEVVPPPSIESKLGSYVLSKV
jgi:hypothetical protein